MLTSVKSVSVYTKMSSTKMDADSTMSDAKLRKRNRKRKESPPRKHGSSKKVRKMKSKEKSRRKQDIDSDSDYSDLDLSKDVRAIGSYVKDREEMLEQMFKAVQGTTLKGLIPDILKKLPVEDLKKYCLEHLEVMSKKRIRKILDGVDPETISSSGTEDESTDEEVKIQDDHVGSLNCSDNDTGGLENGSDRETTTESVEQSPRPADSTSELHQEEADLSGDVDETASQASLPLSTVSEQATVENLEQEELSQDLPEVEEGDSEPEEIVPVKKTRLVKKPKPVRTEEAEEGELSDEEEYEEVTDNGSEDEEVMAASDAATIAEEVPQILTSEESEVETGSVKNGSDVEVMEERAPESDTEEDGKSVEMVEADDEVEEKENKEPETISESSEDEVERVIIQEDGTLDDEEKSEDDVMIVEDRDSDVRVIEREVSSKEEDESAGAEEEVIEEVVEEEEEEVIEEEEADNNQEEADDNEGEEVNEEEDDNEEDDEVDEFDKAIGKLGKAMKKTLQESGVDVLTRNQLEILELEMRARAIKAMLKVTEQREKGFIGKKKK